MKENCIKSPTLKYLSSLRTWRKDSRSKAWHTKTQKLFIEAKCYWVQACILQVDENEVRLVAWYWTCHIWCGSAIQLDMSLTSSVCSKQKPKKFYFEHLFRDYKESKLKVPNLHVHVFKLMYAFYYIQLSAKENCSKCTYWGCFHK